MFFGGGCSSIFNIEEGNTGDYLGGEYEGNYVWGGAMNLAWTDLKDNIVKEDIILDTNDAVAIDMAGKLNSSPFSKEDLDEPSYYIRSGYGQYIVDKINQETKQKFPDKSFADLNFKLKDSDIIAYAYFLKKVEYLNQFKETDVNFAQKKVKGFEAIKRDERNNVNIIKYWNDDKFILSLLLQDDQDQLIIAKGFDMSSPQTIVDEIKNYDLNARDIMSGDDIFEMPKLHLDYQREYQELINKVLANDLNHQGDPYQIAQMYENIKFDLDHIGARVENEGVILMNPLGAVTLDKKPQIKRLIMDKPFWVIMKRQNSQNPYFILGAENNKLMEAIG